MRGRPKKGEAARRSDLIELLELWKKAADSPTGISIPCKRPNRMLQKLYATRREVGGFYELKLVECPTEVKIIPRGS